MNNPLRRVLIVSPHFPPVNAPDHQRVRVSLPYFRQFGWEPVVLAIAPEFVEAPRDDSLAASLPSDVDVRRVSAVSPRITRRFGVGSLAYRSWFQLRREGDRLLAGQRFDLVYFSTTQFPATLLGRRWLARFGVPYAVDIQDPWWTDYYDRPGAPPPPGGWKYRWARFQAAQLEERAWRNAAGFISVSPRYLEELATRYPWFSKKPAAVIPFGASEKDMEFVRQHPVISPPFDRQPGIVHLAAVGAIGPIMRPALEQFFSGLAAWRLANPVAGNRVRIQFIGTSYAPGSRASLSVTPIAAAHGVDNIVSELPQRVGYFAALQSMLSADALLLPGSDEPSYSPSKIASVFLTGRPVLALFPTDAVGTRQINEVALTPFVVTPQGAGANERIGEFLDIIVKTPAAWQDHRDVATFAARYTAEATTRAQAALFDRVVQTDSHASCATDGNKAP